MKFSLGVWLTTGRRSLQYLARWSLPAPRPSFQAAGNPPRPRWLPADQTRYRALTRRIPSCLLEHQLRSALGHWDAVKFKRLSMGCDLIRTLHGMLANSKGTGKTVAETHGRKNYPPRHVQKAIRQDTAPQPAASKCHWPGTSSGASGGRQAAAPTHWLLPTFGQLLWGHLRSGPRKLATCDGRQPMPSDPR